ncbi:MAG TPA: hypothetical protein PLH94_03865 [Fimbriimonadaceae bacterium]|nr:hypothetical protein [Fimbriimonadaceae bacterium]
MAMKSLYVGNLPYSTTADDLNQAFSKFGGTGARIVEGRGFGFVDIDGDQLDAAIAEMHDSMLGGRRLNVNEARPREGGGGGGGGRFGGGGGGGDRGGYRDRDRGGYGRR